MTKAVGSAANRLPAAGWLRTYPAAHLRLDLIAGVSLAAFVIPESLAYASLAQLPPVTGLYCYLVAGIAYALFGTSRQLAVGPTSALAIAVSAGIAAIAGGDPGRAVALASAVALIVGLISIGGRFFGLANAAYFISDPVLVGFKTGAAFYIASTQLPKLFGIEGVSGNFFERVFHVGMSLPDTHLASCAIGLGAIGSFIVLNRLFPGRPTALVVVAAAITVMTVSGLGNAGVKIVGAIPRGLPPIALPDIHLADVAALIPVAFACFLLAYGEAISVARSFAQKHDYDIDPEQELTALGTCNIATGMAHGFPVSGGMSQTAVNDMGGASSPLALIVTSGAIALTLLFLAPLFRNLPEAVLGAIVVMAASHLVRLEDLRQLRIASPVEFRIALLAFAGVLLFGLLNGLLLAAAGSLVLLIAHASRPSVVELGCEAETGHYVSRMRYPDAVLPPGAVIVRSAGAWLYFNAEYIRRRMTELIDAAPAGTDKVVIDFSLVPRIDITGATILQALVRSLKARRFTIELAEMRDDIVEQLKLVGAERDVGPFAAHRTIHDSLKRRLGQ